MTVLPQGYEAAVFHGQGTTMTCLYEAKKKYLKENNLERFNPEPIPTKTFDIVIKVWGPERKQGDKAKEAQAATTGTSSRKLLGVLGVVVDNLIVVGDTEEIMRDLTKHVNTVLDWYNLKLKIPTDPKEKKEAEELAEKQRLKLGWKANITPETITGRDNKTKLGYSFVFLGIEYVYFTDTGLHWRHCRKNRGLVA